MRRQSPILLLAAVLILQAACTSFDDPPPVCKEDLTSFGYKFTEESLECRYIEKVKTADEQLNNFNFEGARVNYFAALDLVRQFNRNAGAVTSATASLQDDTTGDFVLDACRPTYGVFLSAVQRLFSVINAPLALLVGLAVDPDDFGDVLGSVGFAPSLGGLLPSDHQLEQDLGDLVLNFYTGSLQRAFTNIIEAEAQLETMPDCVFIANDSENFLNGGSRSDTFDEKPGVPFRLVSNDSVEEVARGASQQFIAVELRMGERWDLAEARLIRTIVESVQGVLFAIIGHDLTIMEDQISFATQWALDLVSGVGLIDSLECGVLPVVGTELTEGGPALERNSPYFGTAIDPEVESRAEDTNNNGIVDTVLECFEAARTATAQFTWTKHVRALGFLMDHQQTLARHETRWDQYFLRVDDSFANAFRTAEPLLDDLIRRTVRHSNITDQDDLLEYAFVFDDADTDGLVGQGDGIGFQIVDIDLHLPGISQSDLDTLEDAILLVNSFIIVTVSSDDVIRVLNELVNNLANQFSAVDDPTIESERLNLFNLVQPLIGTTAFFGSNAMPDVFELDFTAGFRNDPDAGSPKPLRELLPYWEMVTGFTESGGAINVNEFVIEEELANGQDAYFPWQTTGEYVNGTLVNGGDSPHFQTGPDAYGALDPEISVFQPWIFFDGPNAQVPPDCMKPEDNPDSDTQEIASASGLNIAERGGLSYTYWQDPSFNNLLYVRTSTIQPTCANDSTSFQPATLWSIHRATIAMQRWFDEEFSLGSLLSQFGGAPKAPTDN